MFTFVFLLPFLPFYLERDPCVPYNGNEEWTRGLGLKETAEWAPWFSDPGTEHYPTGI